eukprot:350027-Chlamydomonas_euryale.AAC.5
MEGSSMATAIPAPIPAHAAAGVVLRRLWSPRRLAVRRYATSRSSGGGTRQLKARRRRRRRADRERAVHSHAQLLRSESQPESELRLTAGIRVKSQSHESGPRVQSQSQSYIVRVRVRDRVMGADPFGAARKITGSRQGAATSRIPPDPNPSPTPACSLCPEFRPSSESTAAQVRLVCVPCQSHLDGSDSCQVGFPCHARGAEECSD